MTRLFSIIFYTFLFSTQQKQENHVLKLKLLEIKELSDCYVFSTIKKNSLDTLYLISIKDSLNPISKYKRLSLGKKYIFVIKNKTESLSIPDENFRLRVRNTVVWRGDEDFKKYPLIIENTKGLYIIKHKLK